MITAKFYYWVHTKYDNADTASNCTSIELTVKNCKETAFLIDRGKMFPGMTKQPAIGHGVTVEYKDGRKKTYYRVRR